MSVIAVFSGPFSADGTICERLAERLGYTLVGNDVLRLLAGQIGMRVKVRKGGVDLVVEDHEI